MARLCHSLGARPSGRLAAAISNTCRSDGHAANREAEPPRFMTAMTPKSGGGKGGAPALVEPSLSRGGHANACREFRERRKASRQEV